MKKNFRYFAGLLGLSMLLTLSVSCREIKKGDYSMNEKLNVKDSSSEKTIQEAIAQETKKIDRFDSIPLEYQRKVENGGTIEHISYPTKDYYGDQAEITKFANVYLPAEYKKNPSKKYKVLYLMHGIGGDEKEWGMTNDSSLIKMIMDNLAAKNEIEGFIVVAANGRSGKDFANRNADYNSFYEFGKELRNDLIPYIDAHYSTITDRKGRGMAGLSMGGMQTINIGICQSLDLISSFGAFSAAPTSYGAPTVAAHMNENPQYPIDYFYNICGTEDSIAYNSHLNAARTLPRLTQGLVDGQNYCWQECHGGHDFKIWNLGFYNFAKIFGGKN